MTASAVSGLVQSWAAGSCADCAIVDVMVTLVDMMVMVSLGSKPPGDIRGDGP